jgi:outer membrane protein assembly factor BamB
VFSVAADGLLRGLIPDTGDLALAPARFLPANATATGLLWADGFVYAATSNTCGGSPQAVWAMNFDSEQKPVIAWETDGAPIVGIALGTDGTLYATTGSGESQYANSIVALDGKTLKPKDWIRQDSPFTSTPVVFSENDKSYVTATSNSRLFVLDAASLGGADHRTPLAAQTGRFGSHGVATWRDAAGTRWILGDMDGAISAFKVAANGRAISIERGWASRAMTAVRAPIIVNGVVFALSGGNTTTNAVLYALDPSTGKEMWTSGTTMTAAAADGLASGTGQVYVVTTDNTVWAFGIPLAIN